MLILKVIHGHFKPSNVLLDKHFKPKLCDLDLATKGPTNDAIGVSRLRSNVTFKNVISICFTVQKKEKKLNILYLA